jgi:hypothetical protein
MSLPVISNPHPYVLRPLQHCVVGCPLTPIQRRSLVHSTAAPLRWAAAALEPATLVMQPAAQTSPAQRVRLIGAGR